MKKRIVYFYLMKNEPEKIRSTVPEHIEYWKNLSPNQYLGGPFADRSGGLITFAADNIEQAQKIILNNPFISEGVIEYKEIKEWISK